MSSKSEVQIRETEKKEKIRRKLFGEDRVEEERRK